MHNDAPGPVRYVVPQLIMLVVNIQTIQATPLKPSQLNVQAQGSRLYLPRHGLSGKFVGSWISCWVVWFLHSSFLGSSTLMYCLNLCYLPIRSDEKLQMLNHRIVYIFKHGSIWLPRGFWVQCYLSCMAVCARSVQYAKVLYNRTIVEVVLR